MSILRDFEHRLERIVEGAFTKAFRSGVQPVELARRIIREMEANKAVGVKDVWVPNRYVFHLSQEDHERFAGMERGLARELEQLVIQGAKERGFGLVASPEVEFETDEGLKRGDFRVQPEMTEATGPPDPSSDALPGHAVLALVKDGQTVKNFALDEGTLVIGRLAGSEIELDDPGASRRHAEVRRGDDGYVVVDLGSTNGTLVNGSEIGEHPLRDGDRITIGHSTLEYREG